MHASSVASPETKASTGWPAGPSGSLPPCRTRIASCSICTHVRSAECSRAVVRLASNESQTGAKRSVHRPKQALPLSLPARE